MSGFRRVEHDHGYGYVYDKEHESPEQINTELWDENIDYILALRDIVECLGVQSIPIDSFTVYNVYCAATAVLIKHGKQEEEEE